ncbi:hypothetical protein [Pseudomonas sp. USHLN015]|uniref:hypothetical protein n=1 Tax=Pseudomonas sp. USHLN015 TaxID=3081296 RepID=UPI00301D3C1A
MNPLITLAEWSTRLTRGRISSRELTEIMLERAQRHFASGGHAFIELDEEGARAAEVLRGDDAWLMPTVSVSPPRLADILDEDAYHRTDARVLANPSVVNFIDGCALSIPLPKHPGIALGVCGLGGQDASILQLGASIQRCLG